MLKANLHKMKQMFASLPVFPYLCKHQQKHYDMGELRKIPNVGETTEQDLMAIFDNIGAYKEELESLLTFKFRLCNSQTISF